jgi:arylformamidase
MPYVISSIIQEDLPGMWLEGAPYQKENIYAIEEGKMPPVNYDKHIFKSHSLTHIESAKHTIKNGKSIDQFFEGNYFYGPCQVVKLSGNNFKKLDDKTFHWEVTLDELKHHLDGLIPNKLLLTTEFCPLDEFNRHDPNYVLTLSQEAASWLISNKDFNLYGTTWKSSDYKPGKVDRPIHNTLFKQAVILECLDLVRVPPGEYFLNAYPLFIKDASEAPVTAVLFSKNELKF